MSKDEVALVSGRTLSGRGRERRGSAVVAVVGASATGKSAMALELARVFGGEIVCADSRTVHEELDLGAAKPSASDREEVAHFGLDVVGLDSLCSGPEFASLASSWIEDVSARGRVAIVCGGSALFVESALYQIMFKAPVYEVRWIENEDLEVVYGLFREAQVALPLNWQDREILKRAWRRNRVECRGPLRRPTLILATERPGVDEYKRRVANRVGELIELGLEDEVRGICERHARTPESLCSIGYMEWGDYFAGGRLQALRESIIEHTLQYAARQEDWVSACAGVVRVSGIAEAIVETQAFLDALGAGF